MLEAAKICETAFAVTPAPGGDVPFPTEDLVMAVEPKDDGQIRTRLVDNLKPFCGFTSPLAPALAGQAALTGVRQLWGQFQGFLCKTSKQGHSSHILAFSFQCLGADPCFWLGEKREMGFVTSRTAPV